jgi:hypothetical protein
MTTRFVGAFGVPYATVHDEPIAQDAFITAYLIQYKNYTSYDITRTLWSFNTFQFTPFTPSAARIKATINIAVSISNDSIILVDGSGSSFSLSDYGLIKNRTTSLGSILIDSSVHDGDRITIPLNATGIALLNQAGLTKIAARLKSDVDNNYLGLEVFTLSDVTLEMDGAPTDYSVKTWYTGDPLQMPSFETPAGAVIPGRPSSRGAVFVGEDTIIETILIRFYQLAFRKAGEAAEIALGYTRLMAMVEQAEILLRTDPTFTATFVNSRITNIDPQLPGISGGDVYRVAEITLETISRKMWGS